MKFQNLFKNILNNERFAGWIFILPAILGIFIFIVIPVICSFGLSFTKWDLLNPIQFVGLNNYKEIFSEALFFKIFAIFLARLNLIVYLCHRYNLYVEHST